MSPIQVLNHYNRLNSNYPFFRMMITGVFMHKCTSMMEPGVLRQPILLALQTIQGLDLISCSTFLTVYKQSTPTFHFTIRHMMCCIRGILQL